MLSLLNLLKNNLLPLQYEHCYCICVNGVSTITIGLGEKKKKSLHFFGLVFSFLVSDELKQAQQILKNVWNAANYPSGMFPG